MFAWRPAPSSILYRLLTPIPDAQVRLRMRLPVILVTGLLVLALLTPDRIWTTLLVGLTGLLLIGYFWTRSLAGGLDASRRLRYGWVSVGDRLEEEFVLNNDSAVPALWVEVVDDSTVPGYSAAVVHTVPARAQTTWRKSAVCERRGQYHLGPWTLRSGDPFGLFEMTRRYESTEEIIIHPPVVSQVPIPLPPGQSDGRSRTVSRSWDATLNAAGVRDYQPSDPYHAIHWKTSARRDELYVYQYDRDSAGDIWLLLDFDAAVQVGDGAKGTEEQAVLLAAAQATRAMLENRRVGLAVYGQEPQVVPPGLGQAQDWAILRALALAKADGTTNLERALRDLADVAKRGSAVVIITPSASPNWIPALITLAQHGIESYVLLLDRASFGAEADSADSEGLRRVIVAAGFKCQTLRRENISQPIAEGERHGFWEFKVTGTGKAIAVRRPVD